MGNAIASAVPPRFCGPFYKRNSSLEFRRSYVYCQTREDTVPAVPFWSTGVTPGSPLSPPVGVCSSLPAWGALRPDPPSLTCFPLTCWGPSEAPGLPLWNALVPSSHGPWLPPATFAPFLGRLAAPLPSPLGVLLPSMEEGERRGLSSSPPRPTPLRLGHPCRAHTRLECGFGHQTTEENLPDSTLEPTLHSSCGRRRPKGRGQRQAMATEPLLPPPCGVF